MFPSYLFEFPVVPDVPKLKPCSYASLYRLIKSSTIGSLWFCFNDIASKLLIFLEAEYRNLNPESRFCFQPDYRLHK